MCTCYRSRSSKGQCRGSGSGQYAEEGCRGRLQRGEAEEGCRGVRQRGEAEEGCRGKGGVQRGRAGEEEKKEKDRE